MVADVDDQWRGRGGAGGKGGKSGSRIGSKGRGTIHDADRDATHDAKISLALNKARKTTDTGRPRGKPWGPARRLAEERRKETKTAAALLGGGLQAKGGGQK